MSEETDALNARLSLLVPINKLSELHRAELLKTAVVVPFKKRDVIFRQGARDDFSFYLLEGELDLTADDQLIKRVEGGDGASYQPLSQLQPRKMTATARRAGSVLRVRRSLLDKLLSLSADPGAEPAPRERPETGEVSIDGDRDWLMTMLQSELFSRLPPSNIQRLLDTMESVEVKVGQYIVRQGEPGEYYYALKEGACEVLRRSGAGDRLIRLARLGPGDTFGEEALISNATRNASVRMVTDGVLARLTKERFIELVTRPVLRAVSREEAEARAGAGAVWLDVRYPEEFEANGLPDAVNVPLHLIRARCRELDPGKTYIAYCDTGGRSSVASFLLAEHGIDAFFVEGGLLAEDMPPTAPAAASESGPPAADDAERAAMEATVDATTLTARLAQANIKLAQAQRMMEEAEEAKASADDVVAEKLASEREALVAEAERARQMLEDAARMKKEIERAQREAVSTAEQKQHALEQQLAEVKAEAERRLKEKEAELAAVYEESTAELERLQAEKLDTTQELIAEYEKAVASARRKDEETQRLKDELIEAESRRVRDLEAQERQLREDLQRKLLADRRRLEAELGRLTEELERTRAAEASARAAKEAAADEARRIIEEFARTQEEIRRQERARVAEERAALEQEAGQIRQELSLALKAKAEAEASKRAAESEIAVLKTKLADATAPGAGGAEALKAALERSEALAQQATERVSRAAEAHAEATSAQERNLAALEASYQSEAEINQALQRELEEWVAEHGEEPVFRSGTWEHGRNEELSRRIRAKAEAAKQAKEAHVQSLFDDLGKFDA